MPLFFTKKEFFQWLKEGKKTIDIRKGNPRQGSIAFFQSGPKILKLKIIKKETGSLSDIVKLENYRSIIPSAESLDAAIVYLRNLYDGKDDFFTAYYVSWRD